MTVHGIACSDISFIIHPAFPSFQATQDAADVLNVSRPFLVQLLEGSEIQGKPPLIFVRNQVLAACLSFWEKTMSISADDLRERSGSMAST